MRQDVQNRSVHAVATSIVFHRVSDQGLPDSGPQKDLKDCNGHQLVNINRLELEAIRSRYRILVAKLLFEHFPSFAMFKPYVAGSTDCKYAEEMGSKSEVLTMPVARWSVAMQKPPGSAGSYCQQRSPLIFKFPTKIFKYGGQRCLFEVI